VTKNIMIIKFLQERFGLNLNAKQTTSQDGNQFFISSNDVPRGEGFVFKIIQKWVYIEAKFSLEPFASDLLQNIKNHTPQQKAVFKFFVKSALDKNADVQVIINGTRYEPLENTWPTDWNSFELKFRKTGLEFDQKNPDRQNDLLFSWAATFFGVSLSLLPIESEIKETETGMGKPEGKEIKTIIKKYERSRVNRAACIEHHGIKCKICELSFSEQYSPIGEGFIHVHHLKPLSALQGSYIIDPVNDLIPVCPNCHSMIHKKDPPYTLEEIQNIFKNSKK
jgi:5-methylcytosine-specific restriction enzyme A